MEDRKTQPEKPRPSRRAFDLAGSLLAFVFVWIVFDNLALALIAAVLFGGGVNLAQRAARKKSE